MNPVDGSKDKEQVSRGHVGFKDVNEAMTEVIRSVFKESRNEEEDLANMERLKKAMETMFENRSGSSVEMVYEPPWLTTADGCNGELTMNWEVLEKISEALRFQHNLNVETVKMALNVNVYTLETALEDGQSISGKVSKLVRHALRELKVLSAAFDPRNGQLASRSSVLGVVERLQSMRPMIDDFLKNTVYIRETVDAKTLVPTGSSSTEIEEVCDDGKGK